MLKWISILIGRVWHLTAMGFLNALSEAVELKRLHGSYYLSFLHVVSAFLNAHSVQSTDNIKDFTEGT